METVDFLALLLEACPMSVKKDVKSLTSSWLSLSVGEPLLSDRSLWLEQRRWPTEKGGGE